MMFLCRLFLGLGMCAQLGAGSGFLERGVLDVDSDVQRGLLQEIESLFGKNAASKRLLQLEASFANMYAALPKDDHGSLGPAAVRYALHRYFLQRHGWVVAGLEPNGGLWNESSAIDIIRGRVPSYVEALFEEHLGDRGFTVHELAVFAAVYENLVRIETAARLEAAYTALGLSTSELLDEASAMEVLDMTFMIYILDPDHQYLDRLLLIRERAHKLHPGWEDTRLFLRDTINSLAHSEAAETNPFVPQRFDFGRLLHLTEEIGDKYGHFQDFECQGLTDVLLGIEEKASGRVRLSDFYGLALAGDWRFGERLDYLRTLGALDEGADASNPRVIVANYMYGKNQCIASSSYYSVCCIDHCESLLSHIERTFQAPEALPSQIAEEIAKLPSATVAAPRNLSSVLIDRLNEIAARHGGMVPLHSRSFAQFMHHAYPRECQFPHVSGTIKPMTQREWKAATGEKTRASDDDLTRLGKMPTAPLEAGEEMLDSYDGEAAGADITVLAPWTDEEELVVMRRRAPSRLQNGWSWSRLVFMCLAVGALAFGLLQSALVGKSGVARAVHGQEGKLFV